MSNLIARSGVDLDPRARASPEQAGDLGREVGIATGGVVNDDVGFHALAG